MESNREWWGLWLIGVYVLLRKGGVVVFYFVFINSFFVEIWV